MLIRIAKPHEIRSSEITPERVYLGRRQLLMAALAGATTTLLPKRATHASNERELAALSPLQKSELSVDEEPTSFSNVTSYNNFYEFGTDKEDPAQNSQGFVPKPWNVVFKGEVKKPGRIPLDAILEPHPLEERIYRFRCVETWSMVVPWVGIPLADVLRRFEPTENAKFVEFRTLFDPDRMPGQKRQVLDWPYREGLRMDEAMHPLTLLAVGLYGRELPNQNGAPLRLIVPWKYGFKSIKSIVEIRLRSDEPATTWNQMAPDEYGFYANVNPEVAHPRWSQASERRLGDFLRRDTLPFNGYADEVGSLYAGMDLTQKF